MRSMCCSKPHFWLDNTTVDKDVFVLKTERKHWPQSRSGENTQQTVVCRSEARFLKKSFLRAEKAKGFPGKRDPCKYYLYYITLWTHTHTQAHVYLPVMPYITGFTLLLQPPLHVRNSLLLLFSFSSYSSFHLTFDLTFLLTFAQLLPPSLPSPISVSSLLLVSTLIPCIFFPWSCPSLVFILPLLYHVLEFLTPSLRPSSVLFSSF